MSFKDDLENTVKRIFREQWQTRKGTKVPDPVDLGLGKNDAIEFDRATILYADLSGSTTLVDTKSWTLAAEIYKTFLHCAAEIIKKEGGSITSYDGDRIMAVFIGDSQTTPAARCGLKINYAVLKIINPALKAQYPNENYSVRQVVGIDTSPIRAARTGVRGDNDIVWIGRAANYAAKLTELNAAQKTWVTEDAYNHMLDAAKLGGDPPQNMWKKFTWTEHGNRIIYGSTWHWGV
jgi:class 3 adenylate cyclase